MANEAERGAYLRALGIEQWQPRAQPLEPTVVPAAPSAESTDAPVPFVSAVDVPDPLQPEAAASVSVELAPVATETLDPVVPPLSVDVVPATRAVPQERMRDSLGAEALALAQAQWRTPPNGTARLAVLGIDASGSHLKPRDFEQDWGVLQKMLAAIGEDIDRCAVGGLSWGGEPSENLQTPYALILVDSGEDGAALIRYWQDKLLTVQGATAVIAPHPCMFAQGVSLKRQAWASLQMLQQLWVD